MTPAQAYRHPEYAQLRRILSRLVTKFRKYQFINMRLLIPNPYDNQDRLRQRYWYTKVLRRLTSRKLITRHRLDQSGPREYVYDGHSLHHAKLSVQELMLHFYNYGCEDPHCTSSTQIILTPGKRFCPNCVTRRNASSVYRSRAMKKELQQKYPDVY